MKVFASFISVAIIAILMPASQSIRAQEETPVGIGEKFGGIISAAISTASPAIGTFIELIRDKIKKGSDVRREDVVTVSDLQEQLTAQREKLLADFRNTLGGLISISEEIDVVLDFTEPATDAQQDIIPIIHTLAANQAPPRAIWEQIAKDWADASRALSRLNTLPNDEIRKLSSLYLRDRLTDIRTINIRLTDSVGEAIDRADRTDALIQLNELNRRLSGLTSAAGYLMDDLSSGFVSATNLVAMGNSAASNEVRQSFIRHLDEAASTSEQ